jgi:L-ascorbate metabolism protein UlaG (beta-lactamase superfamily)
MNRDHLTLTLIGGPTVLIEFGGVRLLTDPTFDPPGLYQKTPVHFEKTSGPALSVEAIGPLDGVLLSHDHHLDNLDHAGRAMLPSVPVVYTTVAGEGRLKGHAVGLAPFETRTLRTHAGASLLVTATPARHGPGASSPSPATSSASRWVSISRGICCTFPATPCGTKARPRLPGDSRPRSCCCIRGPPNRAAAST